MRKSILSIGIIGISTLPLLTFVSCSSISYTIIIPKILNEQIKRIQDEISAQGIDQWIASKTNKDELLLINGGYISGGNVESANIKTITVKTVSGNQINFYMEVEESSLNRFLNNKISFSILVDVAAKPIV